MLRRGRNRLLRIGEWSQNIWLPKQCAMTVIRHFLSARDRLAVADSP